MPSFDEGLDRSLVFHVFLDQLPIDAKLEDALLVEGFFLWSPFCPTVRHNLRLYGSYNITNPVAFALYS